MRYAILFVFIFIQACSLTSGYRAVEPRILVKKASVDQRFQSYNVGAIEHIDLKDKKIRSLVTALGPSYIRNDSRLTKDNWKKLSDFAQSVDAKIVHLYSKDDKIDEEVRKLLSYPQVKEQLAAIEIPDDRDVKRTSEMLHKELPGVKLVGSGSDAYQVLSYHRNCSTDKVVEAKKYLSLSNNFLEGKPVWMTDVTNTSCSDDGFVYLDHLGDLSQHKINIVMYQAIFPGLIDEKNYEPKPAYWSALLWNRFMGKTVLNAGPSGSEKLKFYAHCMKGSRGGVTLLVINTDKEKAIEFNIASPAIMYTLHSNNQDSTNIRLNGRELRISEGSLPEIKGEKVSGGVIKFAPLTINFITIPKAGNQVCYFD